MRILIYTGLFLLTVTSAHATGGFDCISADKSIEIFGTTARVAGNPLLGVTVLRDGREYNYTPTQAVGYWNIGNSFKLALADEQGLDLEYQLNVALTQSSSGLSGYGSLKTVDGQRDYSIKCQF